MNHKLISAALSLAFCISVTAACSSEVKDSPENLTDDGLGGATAKGGPGQDMNASASQEQAQGSSSDDESTADREGEPGESRDGNVDSLPEGISFSYDPALDQEAETCASESIQAEEVPLDVFMILDRSGSMEWLVEETPVSGADSCNVGNSINARWCNAINAIDGFARDESSVGMGLAFDTFERTGCGAFPALDIPLATIQADDANGQLSSLTSELNENEPRGGTDTEGALNTLIKFTGERQTELRDLGEKRTVIGIIVTDGEPFEGCVTDTSELNSLVESHFTATGIPTFFIGMTGLDETKLETMAAGAGAELHPDYCEGDATSCSYYSVGTGDSTTFLAALDAIRESVAGCEFSIPEEAGLVNLDRVSVTFTPEERDLETLVEVDDEGSCSAANEYFISGSGNEAVIQLCPAMCERNTTSSSVDISIPCQGT